MSFQLIVLLAKRLLNISYRINTWIGNTKAISQFPMQKCDLSFDYRYLVPNNQGEWLHFSKYPRYMVQRVWFFFSVLVLTHPTVIKKVINMDIPKGFLYEEIFRSWMGDGLVVSSGEKWRKHRKILHPMVHGNSLKCYSAIINSCVDIFIQKQISNNRMGKEDSLDTIYRFISDAAFKCFFSKDDRLQDDDSMDICNKLKSLFHAIFEKLEKPNMYPDFIFNLTPVGRKARQDLRILHKYAEDMIDQRLKENKLLTKNDLLGRKNDVLDILIQASGPDGKGLSNREIRDEV